VGNKEEGMMIREASMCTLMIAFKGEVINRVRECMANYMESQDLKAIREMVSLIKALEFEWYAVSMRGRERIGEPIYKLKQSSFIGIAIPGSEARFYQEIEDWYQKEVSEMEGRFLSPNTVEPFLGEEVALVEEYCVVSISFALSYSITEVLQVSMEEASKVLTSLMASVSTDVWGEETGSNEMMVLAYHLCMWPAVDGADALTEDQFNYNFPEMVRI
jgi:hypothetical protein